MKKTLLAITLSTFFLTACGGDSDSSNNSSPPSTFTKKGQLIDGAIEGVDYYINGKKAGTTDIDGTFSYNEGDEITFKIGDIEIGTVQGAERITPLELATDADAQTNLMVFLQSLDTDGNHDNGITLPKLEDLASLSTLNIDFEQPTTNFYQNLSANLSKIDEFKDLRVVTPLQAIENFNKTMFELMSENTKASLKDIAGIWYFQGTEEDESPIALIIKEDGSYIMGEVVLNEEEKEFNGLEVGKINTYNPSTGLFTASAFIDTNKDWGLTDSGKPRNMILKLEAGQLTIQEEKDPEESATFSQLPNTASGIVGAWKAEAGPIFIFNTDNTYLMLDPVGDDLAISESERCGDAGIEYGTYTLSGNTLRINSIIIDTNGCAGLSDNGATGEGLPISLTPNSLSFTVADEGTFTLSRIN
ncbi:hypothetical protein [Acinetobacter sp. HR7]|uniref:hypothetical protein n=1 Tax=Acinetobacter sp. HR7 TaxID=1509403 RepID=UPI00053891C9|nr:hypothetical protein [Acinetobacter sp. HR7]KGT47322.1 hypothetical protein GW12_16810 [Acinetobacter sp. HR7]